MIHGFKNKHLNVAEVAGNKKRHDLAIAVFKVLAPGGESRCYQMNLGDFFAIGDDVRFGRIANLLSSKKLIEPLAFIRREGGELLKLGSQWIVHGDVFGSRWSMNRDCNRLRPAWPAMSRADNLGLPVIG